MAQPVVIPKLGLTMEEATVVQWHFAAGDAVAKGAVLLTIETDKIASDVEAEASGVLEDPVPLDTVLPVGGIAGYLRNGASAPVAAPVSAASAPIRADPIPIPVAAPAKPSAEAADGERRRASPLARRVAAQRGVDLAAIVGSGPRGAIRLRDVEAAPAAEPIRIKARPDPTPLPAPTTPATATRRPLTAMRRAISQRMMQSLAGTAQMTGFGKIDMTEAVRLRESLAAAEDSLGVRITITDLILKATALALREMPDINASIIGDEIVTWPDVDIGLAVALDDGLVVPILRKVDTLSLVELGRARQDAIARARSRRLGREDLEGGTFTLSNFGSYGGDFETPILNPPQSALLGIGRIADEPAVRDSAICIRAMMMISLTFDHRLIDGAVAGRFRSRLRTLLETPGLMLAHLR